VRGPFPFASVVPDGGTRLRCPTTAADDDGGRRPPSWLALLHPIKAPDQAMLEFS
jgi:hypothetical protein